MWAMTAGHAERRGHLHGCDFSLLDKVGPGNEPVAGLADGPHAPSHLAGLTASFVILLAQCAVINFNA